MEAQNSTPVKERLADDRRTKLDVIAQWVSYTCQHYSANTCVQYAQVVWKFSAFIPEYVADLTAENIESYLATVRGLKPNSYNAHLVAIKSFCHWVYEDHDLPNPAKRIKPVHAPTIAGRVLTKQEYAKVLAVCTSNEGNIIKFLANTGLRITEFLELNQEHISPDQKYLQIIGKGRKPRVVPLNRTAQEIMNASVTRKRDSRLNFVDFIKHLTYNQVNYLCHRLAKRAGIKHFTCHALRHFFATQLMQTGNVPLAKISKCLGHSSVLITEKVYLHWCNQDLVGVTDCLDGQ